MIYHVIFIFSTVLDGIIKLLHQRKSSLEDLFPLKFTQLVTIKAKSQTSFFDQIYIHT